MRRWLAILAILPFTLFVLLLALEPFLHHHEGGEDRDHACQVCKWLDELRHTLTVFYFPAVAVVVFFFPMRRARPVAIWISGSSSIRAPPAGPSF